MQTPYWAFISYSHADEAHAKWVHTWLEAYRVPGKIAGTKSERHGFERPARLRPVYRDADEFSAGHSLSEHIQLGLDNSRNLIVVCSPSAVKSPWVSREI